MSETVFDDPPKDIVELLRAVDPRVASPQLVETLLHRAAATIERLRSITGKADVGPSFSELTDELRHQTPGEG